MPIVYAPQAPVSGYSAAAYEYGAAQNAANRARASGGVSSGGGYGVDPSVLMRMYDNDADRMQAAIANRDRMDFEARRFAAGLDAETGMQNLRAHNEAALQDQRIQGQMAMQNNELSQQEKIRYMRMKNALGSVEADPTLTAEEKANMRTMLQSGINPYEQRLARQKVEAQAEANRMLADQRRTQASLNEADLKLSAQSFNERTAYHVDSSVLSQIIGDLKKNLPGADRIPPQVLAGMANEIAMSQGLGQTFYQESPGKWAPVSGGTGKGSSSGSKSEGGMNEDKFMKLYDSAVDQAMKEQAKATDGVPVHPQTVEWFNERVQQIVQERTKALQGFSQTQPQRGYRSPFAAEPATVAKGGKRTEYSQAAINDLGTEAQRISNRSDLPADLQYRALEAIQVARQIMGKYPNPDDMPEKAREKLEAAMKVYRELPRDPSILPREKAGGAVPAKRPAVPSRSQGDLMESPF